MSALKDLTGQRFGRLVVIERVGSDKHKHATWKCQCDCSNVSIVSSGNLVQGISRSCGCVKVENAAKINLKHGNRRSRLYHVWQDMKKRCYNPKTHNYYRYGGRGITICDEWRDDFGKFYEWAMSNGYDESAPYMQCTIDRIDNDKGYSPDNCRWVDVKVQNNNQSKNRKEK